MARRIFAFSLLVLLAGLVLVRCSGPSEPDEPDYSVLPRALTAEEIQLAASADYFGLKLFREVVRQEADKNIFISPLSVSMALGMTANGAAGTTFDSMRATLELADLTEAESNAAYQSLIELLAGADPKVQFDIANSIWFKEGAVVIDPAFHERCQDYFSARVQGLDFSKPEAADIMNAWVEESTEGKITDIVGKPIDPLATLFLINAIYFKGTWTFEFDPKDTQDDEFTRLDGTTITCRMMNQEQDLLYMSNDLFRAVDLPYGDGLFSMTVLLPRTDVHVDTMIAMLTPENWADWLGQLESRGRHLQLPKFSLEYDLGMNGVLRQLGMSIAMDVPGQADFSRFGALGGYTWIDTVIHKTFVKVDEEGTEAAAATVVVTHTKGTGWPLFRVDRPFVFVIRERTSGALLFMGKIVEPVWEEG